MKHREFEALLLEHRWNDEDFYRYLQEHSLGQLSFEIEEEEMQKGELVFDIFEPSTLDYIEELCAYDADTISDTREATLAAEMKRVLYYAFFYFKEGMSYMDLVQEGIVGALKGIDFSSERIDLWIVRELFLKWQAEIQNLKFEFKNFLRLKREDLEKKQHSCDCHEGDCSCSHSHEEEHCHDGKVEREEEQELSLEREEDTTKLLEKILQNASAIDKVEEFVEEYFSQEAFPYRLYDIEIEVLNYYFGLQADRRYSIYEIEQTFGLQAGHGQNIFESAMYKLSTVKGKMEL